LLLPVLFPTQNPGVILGQAPERSYSRRFVQCRSRSQQKIPVKIFVGILSYFSMRRKDRPLTTFTTQSTTNSPQKDHTKNSFFPKPLSKTREIRSFCHHHHRIFFLEN